MWIFVVIMSYIWTYTVTNQWSSYESCKAYLFAFFVLAPCLVLVCKCLYIVALVQLCGLTHLLRLTFIDISDTVLMHCETWVVNIVLNTYLTNKIGCKRYQNTSQPYFLIILVLTDQFVEIYLLFQLHSTCN